MATVIGSLKMARGLFAADSRRTTETIANCSCVNFRRSRESAGLSGES